MGTINISNSNGRDAIVNTQSVKSALKLRWLDEEGRQASTVRLLKASLTTWSRISPGQPAMSSTKRRRSSANNAREASSKPGRLPAMTDMK